MKVILENPFISCFSRLFHQTAKRKRGHIKNKLVLRKGKKLQKK